MTGGAVPAVGCGSKIATGMQDPRGSDAIKGEKPG